MLGDYGRGELMRALFTVFAKEFLENLRDRRTLLSALLFGPLFGPLLFGVMVSRMLDQSVVESDEPLKITISGAEHAPGLTPLPGIAGRQAHQRASCRRTRRGPRCAAAARRSCCIVPAEYRRAVRRGDARAGAAGRRQLGFADAQDCGSRAQLLGDLRQRHRAIAAAGARRESAARRAGGGQRGRCRDARPGAPWWCSAS